MQRSGNGADVGVPAAHGVVAGQTTIGATGNRFDGIELEFVITSRRSWSVERMTMAKLRQDLNSAIGCFSSVLQ